MTACNSFDIRVLTPRCLELLKSPKIVAHHLASILATGIVGEVVYVSVPPGLVAVAEQLEDRIVRLAGLRILGSDRVELLERLVTL